MVDKAAHSGTECPPPPSANGFAAPGAGLTAEELAAAQWAVFATWQKPEGLTASGARNRVARGKLFRLYRGVYSFVPPKLLRVEGRYAGAVLACGSAAALARRAAAAHWELRSSSSATFDVTVPHGSARSRRGIRVHHTRSAAITRRRGIPVTTVEQTIADLAEELDRRGTERLIERAVMLGLLDVRRLEQAARGRSAAPVLTSLLAQYHGHTATRSDSEELYLRIIRADGRVPEPMVNIYVEGHERDFVYPRENVIVEIDARSTHDTPRAWEQDRIRDQAAIAAGWTVVRFTKRQLEEEPAYVAAYTSSIVNASSPTSRNLV